MADRTVNININYKVNTADVQKATAASAAADQATQNLTKSAQTYGNVAPGAYQKVNRNIETMTVEMQRLRAQIQLTQLTDTKRLQELTAKYQNLKQIVDQANKALLGTPAAIKKTSDATQIASNNFNSLYTGIKAVLTAGLVREVVSISLEMSRLAGNTESVTRAFQNQIPNATALLAELRRATQGTVTDFDLMQKALQSANFGIDVQQLPKLLEFAQVRAQQTGVAVDYLVNSIVTGIGRKSLLILDNLGISANRLKEEFNGASIKSQSVGDVTAAVSRIATEELKKMGGAIETAATSTDQLNVSWQKFRTTLSTIFIEGSIPKALKGFIDSFQTLAEAQLKGISVSELYKQRQTEEIALISANEFASRRLTGTREENIQALQEEIAALTHSVGAYGNFKNANEEAIKSLTKERDAIALQVKGRQISAVEGDKEVGRINREIDLRKRLTGAKIDDTLIDQEILKLLQQRLVALQTVNDGEIEQTGIIERKKQQIEDLQEAIEKTNNPADLGPGGLLVKQLEIAQAELADLQRAFIEFTKIPKAILDYQAEIKKNVKSNDIHEANQQFADEFFNIDEVTKRIEANLDAIANGFIKISAHKPGIVDLRSELEKVFDDAQQFFIEAGTDIIANQIISIASQEANSYALRINNLQSFYKEQQVLAGDNEKQKDILRLQEDRKIKELRRQQFQAEQRAQIAAAVVNTAASITKTASNLGFPAAIPFIIVAAAEGAAQIAIIKRQQSNFAKGVLNLKGPGTETSDSIPANLSKGESVMTARETRESGNILKAIRENRLNDKLLQSLHLTKDGVKVVGMSDERIVKAINANKPPDIIRIGNQIYEAKKSQDGVSTRIRRKAMG